VALAPELVVLTPELALAPELVVLALELENNRDRTLSTTITTFSPRSL
jgi:hypothetical protein